MRLLTPLWQQYIIKLKYLKDGEKMKIDRLMSIILVLLDKKRMSACELADMFEVSLRTIYRDIDAIDLAGIPIRSTPGVGGGFEIMPNYKLDKKCFSATDLSAILMGLSSLTNMMRGDELINAIAKVKSFIPSDRAKEIEFKVNQILIDLNQWSGNSNIQSYLEIIRISLQHNKLLSFGYIAHHGYQTKRIVEPYQLVFKSNHWYLYGFCQKKTSFRLFRLSRISNLQLLEQTFMPRDYQKPQLEFDETLSTLQIEIKIRIHISIMDRVLDYCSFENFSADGDEHYIVTYPFVENDYHYDILLSFGEKCECLEPARVRAKMKKKIYDLANIYHNG